MLFSWGRRGAKRRLVLSFKEGASFMLVKRSSGGFGIGRELFNRVLIFIKIIKLGSWWLVTDAMGTHFSGCMISKGRQVDRV